MHEICRQVRCKRGVIAGDPHRHRQQPRRAALGLARGHGGGGGGATAGGRRPGRAALALVPVGAGAAVGSALVRKRRCRGRDPPHPGGAAHRAPSARDPVRAPAQHAQCRPHP